jgi:Holliday junction resolvasome RuvABC endonuclease subunit
MQKLTEEFVSQLSRSDVMAFDVASHCGFYTLGEYGTKYFPNNEKAPKKLGPDYAQHKAFRQWLVDMLTSHHIKVVAAEDVIFGHFIDFRKLCEFRGILFEVCETLDIPIVVFKPSDIKKHGTGNGNATKQMMIDYAEKRYHIEVGKDDNLADAIHIYMYFIHRYKL